MEFIELGDLETCIQSPLDETQAGRIVVQVAKALEAMHTQGFVHRDLKPNVSNPQFPRNDLTLIFKSTEHICQRASAYMDN